MFYIGRVLGVVSLVIGLASTLTCVCLPTSVALCVYGFVVYMNQDVRRAFALRARGAPLEQIDRAPGPGR
jgi:hypothetical protein